YKKHDYKKHDDDKKKHDYKKHDYKKHDDDKKKFKDELKYKYTKLWKRFAYDLIYEILAKV
ncbi:MAG: hypothetical protein M3270_00075, partial [Thermoproteota archaeon]|nr:hypothetical protein [Thermoproteota archaeon]